MKTTSTSRKSEDDLRSLGSGRYVPLGTGTRVGENGRGSVSTSQVCGCEHRKNGFGFRIRRRKMVVTYGIHATMDHGSPNKKYHLDCPFDVRSTSRTSSEQQSTLPKSFTEWVEQTNGCPTGHREYEGGLPNPKYHSLKPFGPPLSVHVSGPFPSHTVECLVI